MSYAVFMEYKTPISALLPAKLVKLIDDYAEENNLSRTKATEQLIEYGFRYEDLK